MNSRKSWCSWRDYRRVNGQRVLTNLRRVTSTLIHCQKNPPSRISVEFKAATLRDNINIVPAKFRDAMLGGKCRCRHGPSYLSAACDRDHDGRLLLAFLRCLDLETAAASDDGE